MYAAFLTHMGRTREAISFAEKAVEGNPSHFGLLSELIKFYILAGEIDKALNGLADYETLFPRDKPAAMGKNYLLLNKLTKAIDILENQPDIPLFKSFLSISYLQNGDYKKAKRLIEQLETVAQKDNTRSINYSIALYYATSGEIGKALTRLEKAYDLHDTELYGIKIDPFLKSLHGEPRYNELLKKIGFSE